MVSSSGMEGQHRPQFASLDATANYIQKNQVTKGIRGGKGREAAYESNYGLTLHVNWSNASSELEMNTHNCFLTVPLPSGSSTLKAPMITSSGSAPGGKRKEGCMILRGGNMLSLRKEKRVGGNHTPFSFSPNMVRKTVKLMGPLASLIMASSSSFFTFRRPAGGGRGILTTEG